VKVKKRQVEFYPYAQSALMELPADHEVLLGRQNPPKLIGDNTVLYLEDIPVLMRLDGWRDHQAMIGEVYEALCLHDFPMGGVKRIHTGAAYVGTSWGTTERRDIRKRMGVQMSRWSTDHPRDHWLLTELTNEAWRLLEEHCQPMWYAMGSAPQAQEHWRIGNTPYTSGVINVNAPLPYHKDRGNVPDTGSAMWTFNPSGNVGGGHLHIPSLNVIIRCGHGTLVVFYGEKFWHGVTRMQPSSKRFVKRISVVTYSKRGILKAGPPMDEHKQAAIRGTRAMDDIRDTVIKHN